MLDAVGGGDPIGDIDRDSTGHIQAVLVEVRQGEVGVLERFPEDLPVMPTRLRRLWPV